MPYPNYHAARMIDPDQFSSIVVLKTLDNGIMIYGGKLKSDPSGGTKTQAYRFPKDKFTADQADKWLKDNKLSPTKFESAIKNFTDVADLLNGEYETINDLEIFNILPNSHKIKFNETDIDEMIESFNQFKDIDQPNIKLSHSDQQVLLKEIFKMNDIPFGEELPVLGYLDNFRKVGKSIVADAKKIPKVLKEVLFGGKLFKTISPEIVFNYRDTGKKFVKAISLTNNPSLKHIADVHMSDALGYDGNLIIQGDSKMEKPNEKDQSKVDFSEDQKKGLFSMFSEWFKNTKPEKKEIPDASVDKSGVVSMSDFQDMKSKLDEQSKVINDLSVKLIEKEKYQKNFSDQLSVMKEKARMETVEGICTAALHEGVPKAIIEHFKPVLLSEAGESKIKFSEIIDDKKVEGEKSVTEVVKDFFKTYPNKIDFSDRTTTNIDLPSDDKYNKIQKKVDVYMSQGMDRYSALIKAGEEIG